MSENPPYPPSNDPLQEPPAPAAADAGSGMPSLDVPAVDTPAPASYPAPAADLPAAPPPPESPIPPVAPAPQAPPPPPAPPAYPPAPPAGQAPAYPPVGSPPPPPGGPYGAPPAGYGAPSSSYGAPPMGGAYGAPMPGVPAQAGYGFPTGQLTRPPAMDNAVKLMKAGAGLSVLGLLVGFLSMGDMRSAVEKAAAEKGVEMDSATIDAAVTVGIGFGVVSGLIGAGLWWWMASANGKGRSWARVVATIFFVLSLFSTLYSLAQPTSGALAKLLAFITLGVGAAALFFMYKRESSEYYAASSRPGGMY